MYVVSQGPQIKMVTVPRLLGKDGDEAAVALQNAGLNVGSVSYEGDDVVPVGKVKRQSIAQGTQVEEGATIDYVISTCLLYTSSKMWSRKCFRRQESYEWIWIPHEIKTDTKRFCLPLQMKRRRF